MSKSSHSKDLALAAPSIFFAIAITAGWIAQGWLGKAANREPVFGFVLAVLIFTSPLAAIYTAFLCVWLAKKKKPLCILVAFALVPLCFSTLYVFAVLMYALLGGPQGLGG